MKAWAVIGALMSLLATAPPEAVAEREREDGERRREPAGYAIEGASFYVWDEDHREAEEWAWELAESWARAIVAAQPGERDE